jgi:hypothetical protein
MICDQHQSAQLGPKTLGGLHGEYSEYTTRQLYLVNITTWLLLRSYRTINNKNDLLGIGI